MLLPNELCCLKLELNEPNAQLDILVENTGRVNFGHVITGERAGITKQVTLAGGLLAGWEIYSLPMTDLDRLSYSTNTGTGPCLLSWQLRASEYR